MVHISANPKATTDEWERRGDAALVSGNYADAARAFDVAAEASAEPGRLAFKQATAYFHMGRYRDAERFYRCVIESESVSEWRAPAYFNLGTTLLFASDGRDVNRLGEAIRSFNRCLASNPADTLRDHARHNLELAKLLWKRANTADAPPPDSEPKSGDPSTGSTVPDKIDGGDTGTNSGTAGSANGSRTSAAGATTEPRPMGSNEQPTPGAGNQPVNIPESEQSQPLSPAEARELLRQTSERIARERRALQKGTTNGNGRGYPDW